MSRSWLRPIENGLDLEMPSFLRASAVREASSDHNVFKLCSSNRRERRICCLDLPVGLALCRIEMIPVTRCTR